MAPVVELWERGARTRNRNRSACAIGVHVAVHVRPEHGEVVQQVRVNAARRSILYEVTSDARLGHSSSQLDHERDFGIRRRIFCVPAAPNVRQLEKAWASSQIIGAGHGAPQPVSQGLVPARQ